MVKTKRIFILVIFSITLFGCGGNDGDTTPPDQTPAENITITFNLDSLPTSINYNRATTPDGYVEFNWSATFDINGDGAINQGDIVLQILHFKSPGSTEQSGTINDLSAALWVYTTDTEITSTVGISKQISGNSITLTADKSLHQSLSSITASTLVYFETSIRDDVTSSTLYDYHPGFNNYSNIPTDYNFTDDQGDVGATAVDMISIQVSL